MKRFGSTPERRSSCARLERQRAPSHSKVPSTKWPMRAASIHWPFGLRTMPRSSRSPASHFPQRRCASATRKAPSASAGSAGRSHPGRCATVTDYWSAGAWVRRHFPRLCSRARPKPCCVRTAAASWKLGRTTWARAPGPRWLRSRRIASGSTLIKSSSDPETPTCRTPVSQAARPTPRPPAWRYTTPAPTSLHDLPISRPTTIAHRCTAPATLA